MPTFGFGLFFGLDTGDTGSFDGVLRRRRTEAAEKPHDNEPLTEASLPSGLSLADKIMPLGIGALEKAAFFGSVPATASSSYLFFLQAAHFYAANPRYIVYRPLDIPSGHYALGYFAGDFEDYSAEEQAEYVGQARSNPAVHWQHSFPAYIWSPSYRPAQSAQRSNYKSLQMPRYETRPETAAPYQQIAETKVKVQNASGQIIPITGQKTIEIIVAKAEIHMLQGPKARVYAAQPLPAQFQILPKPSFEPSRGLRLDSRVQLYSAPKPLYAETKPYQAAEKPRSAHGNEKPPGIIYGNFNSSGYPRNYDMNLRWINILSSGLWRNFLIQNEKQENERYYNKGNPAYKKPAMAKNNDKIKPAAESHAEAKDEKHKDDGKLETGHEQGPVQEYQAEKDNAPAKTEEINPAYKTNEDAEKPKKDSPKKKSVFKYIGIAAAGLGLLGLAALADLSFRESAGQIKQQEYSATDYVSQKPEEKTIDNVVAPIINLETRAYTDLVNKLQAYVKKLDELGYGKKGASVLDTKTKKPIFTYNGDVNMVEPSKVKPALVLAVLYRAQQGLFDLNADVPFRKELYLERETGIEEYIFERDGIKYIRVNDLLYLAIPRSNNTAASHLAYALAQNGAFKTNQTSEEVVQQFENGTGIYESVMSTLGIQQVKLKGPFLNEEKARELKFKSTYKSNTITPNAVAGLHASVKEGELLDSYHNGILKDLLENEETAAAQREILGQGTGLKPSIHPYGAGISGFTPKNISFDLSLDDSPEILYMKNVSTELRHLHRFYTPQAVRTNQFETEFIRIIKQGELQESLKQNNNRKAA